MSQEQEGISLPVPCLGACAARGADVGGEGTGAARGGAAGASGVGLPAAGTFWQDSVIAGGGHGQTSANCAMDGGGLLSAGKSCKSRPVSVAYVLNNEPNPQNNAECMALRCLKDACEAVGSKLETVHFGKLDFGETTVLDIFYNAGKGRTSWAAIIFLLESVFDCLLQGNVAPHDYWALECLHKCQRSHLCCVTSFREIGCLQDRLL